MKKASKTSDRTPQQEREFRSVVEGITGTGVTLVLDKLQPDKEQLQRFIGNGPAIKQAFNDMLLAMAGDWMDLLLKPVNSKPVVVPAIGEMVITEKLLREQYNIKFTGSNFDRLFLGKPIKAVAAANTTVNALAEKAKLAAIYEHVGETGRMSLGQGLWYVGRQKDGRPGDLLVDNYQANLFFVEVKVEPGKFETWAVHFYWHRDGGFWHAGAHPLASSRVWNAGHRVVSSDSKLGT